MIEAPLKRHQESIGLEWIDYNGHMNVAYYVLIFDHATDIFFDALAIGEDYVKQTNCSTFAIEAHVIYKREVLQGMPVAVQTQLLDYDSKRLHYFHAMHQADEGYLVATLEQISIHVDLETRRPAGFPDDALHRIEGAMAAHRALARPAEVGSVIGITRRSS